MRDEVRLDPPATQHLGDQAKAVVEKDITIRYSLDREITRAEERVQALKDVKKRLEDRGILDCEVRDLREAMREIY